MTTSKPFATISYNNVSFLKVKLADLISQNVIDFYAFIRHRPESDEKKAHIHLYIVPSSKCNTKSVLDVLQEKDSKHEKPLGCMPAISSKFGDWYMYNLHDKSYLLSKGQTREHIYFREDFQVSDEDYFDDCIHRIDRSKWVGHEKIVSAVREQRSFMSLVRNGQVPVHLIKQYEYMYNLLSQYGVNRNGRDTHTPYDKPHLVDSETGEIIHDVESAGEKLSAFDNPFFAVEKQESIAD